MDCCCVQACVASVESGKGIGTKGRKSGGLWKSSSFSFCAFLPLPLPALFAPPLQAIEFAQCSFTVHNKVVVTENLGSVLQFHPKDIEKTADVYSWQRCNAKLETNLRVLRDSPDSWGYHYRNQKTYSISYSHAVKIYAQYLSKE